MSRRGIPADQVADEVNAIDQGFLAGSLKWIRHFAEKDEFIEDAVKIREIINDLGLAVLVEMVLMSQNEMALRNAAKNS